MRRVVRISVALFAVVLMAQLSWAAEDVRVIVERANLRSQPSTGSAIVGKVSRGTVLTVLAHEGDWIRVSDPGTGATAYIAARLCESVASSSVPAAAASSLDEPGSSGTTFAPSGSSGGEPGQIGGQLDLASGGIGFGVGVRASSGIPKVPHLGILGTLDVFLGAQAIDYEGVEVDADGHSLQLGLYPTYGYELGSLHAYAGAGLSVLRTSYTISVAPIPDVPAFEISDSQWDASLGLVGGVRFRERFFGELRYQFGGGSHLVFSAGVVFDGPW